MIHLDHATRAAMRDILYSAIDVDGGATSEQTKLLDALSSHVLMVSADPVASSPDEAGAAIADPDLRRVMIEGLVTFELMRHPASAALTDRVGEYIAALGGDDATQVIARDYVEDARDQVAADWARVHADPDEEPGLGELAPDDFIRRIEAFAKLPVGTVGRSFHDFYERNGFALPVDNRSLINHDFTHILAGYEAKPEGELALQAMLVAGSGGKRHFGGLLASLLLFEVGMMPVIELTPRVAVLDRPGAIDLFADAMVRGAAAGVDFADLDHMALIERDLVELRAELGIPAPVQGPFTFIT